jgi:hypothetical protein
VFNLLGPAVKNHLVKKGKLTKWGTNDLSSLLQILKTEIKSNLDGIPGSTELIEAIDLVIHGRNLVSHQEYRQIDSNWEAIITAMKPIAAFVKMNKFEPPTTTRRKIYTTNKLFKAYSFLGPKLKSFLIDRKILPATSETDDVSDLLKVLRQTILAKKVEIPGDAVRNLRYVKFAINGRQLVCHQVYGQVGFDWPAIIEAQKYILESIIGCSVTASKIDGLKSKILSK